MVVPVRLSGLILALSLVATGVAAGGGVPLQTAPAATEAKPGFALPSSAGASVVLGPRAGRVTIVHFFATSCEACREEIPALQRMARRLAGRPVTILAVSVGDNDMRIRRFFADIPVTYPVLLDRDRAVARAWGVYSLPTTYVVDGALRPRRLAEREVDWDNVAATDKIWSSTGRGER